MESEEGGIGGWRYSRKDDGDMERGSGYICFPDHSDLGFRIAGPTVSIRSVSVWPSSGLIELYNSCWYSSRVNMVSLLVSHTPMEI